MVAHVSLCGQIAQIRLGLTGDPFGGVKGRRMYGYGFPVDVIWLFLFVISPSIVCMVMLQTLENEVLLRIVKTIEELP